MKFVAEVVFCGRYNIPYDFAVRAKDFSLVSCFIDEYFGARRCKWVAVEFTVDEEARMC